MFRRKPPLPTRPTPPTFEAIQEDLNNASEDVVFTLLPDGSNLEAVTDCAAASSNESDGPMTADAAFLKVKHFMEMSDKDRWPCRSATEEDRTSQIGQGRFAQRDRKGENSLQNVKP
uniref:Uncharacterized protein n=1 Tax=Amblyomma tuberculatum TaxID=48802 RepID=A0A6M2E561_9ACAR